MKISEEKYQKKKAAKKKMFLESDRRDDDHKSNGDVREGQGITRISMTESTRNSYLQLLQRILGKSP
jgi:hypothetical protein